MGSGEWGMGSGEWGMGSGEWGEIWLGLEIGNSRLHWGWFVGETLVCAWDTDYLSAEVVQQVAECQRLEDLPPEILLPKEGDEGVGSREWGRGDEGEGGVGSGEWGRGNEGEGGVGSGEWGKGDEGEGGVGSGEWGKGDEGNEENRVNIDNYYSSPSPPLPTPHSPLPLLLASVVPSQTTLWQSYPNVRVITLDQVPLQGVYPTLGIDRALGLWGAGQNWGFPMLVIDAGTALTFTGADANHCLVGGAILPGLGLQLATLTGRTGQLPTVDLPQQLPQRYAVNTQEAMQSGVIYTLVAGIKDFVEAWWDLFPEGNVAMTGGDRTLLISYLQSQFPEITARLLVDPNLRFWGMREIVTSEE